MPSRWSAWPVRGCPRARRSRAGSRSAGSPSTGRSRAPSGRCPASLRHGLARLLGIDPAATQLPTARAVGADRLRAPLRRIAEVVAHARRVGPWRDAVLAAEPAADVYACKALIALPVVRGAARDDRRRLRLRHRRHPHRGGPPRPHAGLVPLPRPRPRARLDGGGGGPHGGQPRRRRRGRAPVRRRRARSSC